MLIKKKTVSVEVVEIKLPIYFKTHDPSEWYAVFSEKKSIKVTIIEENVWVRNNNDIEDILSRCIKEEITAEDFQFAFEMAIDRLRKSFIPVTEKQIV